MDWPIVKRIVNVSDHTWWFVVVGLGWDEDLPWRPWPQVATGRTDKHDVPTISFGMCGLYLTVAWYHIRERSLGE